MSISLQFRKNKIKSASWNWTGNPKREREREREREITRFLFELIKNNIGGFIFFFGAFKASNEREDFVECFGFDVVASDFALFLDFLLRWSIHRFSLSLSLSLRLRWVSVIWGKERENERENCVFEGNSGKIEEFVVKWRVL